MTRFAETYGAVFVRFVELALSVVVAAALCYTVQGGFNISEEIHANVALDIVVCAALQAILLAGTVKRSVKIAAWSGYAAIAVFACVAAVMMAPEGNPVDDAPQNLFVAVVIFAVVNVAVFALSRKAATCVALFGIGAFTCGFIQFLYTMNMLVATVVFLFAAGMLIALRAYLTTAELAAPGALPLLGKASVAGIAMPFAACLMACVVVLGVIMPLNPPHAVIKLFNEYVAYEEDRVRTAVELDSDAEKTVTSSNVDESLKPRTTSDKKESDDPQTQTADNVSQNRPRDYLSDDYSDVDLSGMMGNAQELALNLPFPWQFLVLALVLLFLLLLTVPRYLVHRLRLKRMTALRHDEQIAALYGFFLTRFEKLGIGKPEALSPVEYANMYRSRLNPYVGAQAAGTFDHMTALFVLSKYAGITPDDEDMACMRWMYWEFYARCRKQLGLVRYGFRHFTL